MILIGNQMVYSYNYKVYSYTPYNFPRLKAREIIRIWTKRK